MKRIIELSKFDICYVPKNCTRHILILIMLGSVLLSATPVSAEQTIVVDGHKSVDEWNENWAYNQTQGIGYNPVGPFGDR